MNGTLWNSAEEVLGYLLLEGTVIGIYSYAIFLSYAIYDYQNEKPALEKCPIDILMKDTMNAQFCFLYILGLVQFISLISPPIPNIDIVYFMNHTCLLVSNFFIVSGFVHLYIQHIYVFQPDKFINLNYSSMRWKSFFWKVILTLFAVTLSIAIPFESPPIIFRLFRGDAKYER